MTLPPKALNVLINLKAQLLDREPEQSVIITPEPKRKLWMRRAPRPNAFQRMCQRKNR
jgi:hypothetical protein